MQFFPQISHCSACINTLLILIGPLLDFLQSIIDYKQSFHRIQHYLDYKQDSMLVSPSRFYGGCSFSCTMFPNQIFHSKQDNSHIEQVFLNELHGVYMLSCMRIEVDWSHNDVVMDYKAAIILSLDLSDRVCSGHDEQFLLRTSNFFLGNYACLNCMRLTTGTYLAHTFSMILMWIFYLGFNSRILRGSVHLLINKNNFVLLRYYRSANLFRLQF